MRTIAIAGGKGGVGKSTLTANLGAALAQTGLNVVVFDADLALANLDVVLGAKPEFSLQHVLADQRTMREVVAPTTAGVGLIAGGSAIGNLMRSGPKRIGKLLGQLAELEKGTDIVLFDTSAGIDSKVMTFCRLVDEVLLVTTPDPASVTDAYATAKTLFRHRPDAPIRVIVNQALNSREAEAIFAKLSQVCQSFLNKNLLYGGAVRFDAGAAECVRRRSCFVATQPAIPASQDVVAIARSLRSTYKSLSKGAFCARVAEMFGPAADPESASAAA